MDDYDFSWGLSDYGSDYSEDTGYFGDDSGWNASDVDANSPWTDYTYGGDYSTGSGSDSNNPWMQWLMQAGLQAGAGYLESAGKQKMTAEELKLREKLDEQKYAFQKAEDEKYYQAHGKQLSDAYGKYKQYYTKPTDHGPNNPTSLFGLLAPQTPQTAAVNGYAFDPQGVYPPLGGAPQGRSPGLLAPVPGDYYGRY